MDTEDKQIEQAAAVVGEMHKRRETMADGRRYIIFYTFGDGENEKAGSSEVKENV